MGAPRTRNIRRCGTRNRFARFVAPYRDRSGPEAGNPQSFRGGTVGAALATLKGTVAALSTARLLALLSLTAPSLVACTSDWDREPEMPRHAWEEYPAPGVSTATATPAPAVDYYAADDNDPSALVTFRPALAPYGTWYEDPYYGTVWYPDPAVVGTGFSPYLTNGHWSYTSQGYYWNSDYAWGWATFHYGRWVWIDNRGWVWIPGARYSPAWVDWRYGSGYMGWGPAYPRYCWRGGSAVWIDLRPVPYVFAPSGSFFHPNPSAVIVGPSAAPGLVAGTQPYTPPATPVVGATPFVGPDPKVAAIPPSDIAKATIPEPAKGKPENIAWTPAPQSKLAPHPSDGTMPSPNAKFGGAAPGAKGSNLPPPSYAGKPGYVPAPTAGGKTVTLPGGGYGPNAPAVTAPKWNGVNPYSPKPYGPPTAYAPPSAYSPAPNGGPKPFNPPPAYKPPPSYSPPPSYGGGYGGGGFSPAPKPYSPPPSNYGGGFGGGGFSPAPKPYSPPPSFGGGGFGGGGGGGYGGGGFSPAPKPYSPGPSFGGGGPSFGGGGGGFSGPKPGGGGGGIKMAPIGK